MTKVKREKNPEAEAAIFALEKGFGKNTLQVGWFSNSRYDDAARTPVAYVASVHEYGSRDEKIPPRSFVRPTIREQRENWKKFISQGAKRILAGQLTAQQVLEQLGLHAAGKISAKISDIYTPPLAASTIRARVRKRANKKAVGSLDKPLVDFGILIKTCTYVVEKK